jgi:Ca2+/H+ antiporter
VVNDSNNARLNDFNHFQKNRKVKSAESTVLLVHSLLVASFSLGTGRTTIMQATIHLVIFAVYLFMAVVP